MKLITKITSAAVAVAFAISITGGTAYAASPTFNSTRDCDANAIMYCGAMSATELQDKYAKEASIATVYDYFGIRKADVADLNNSAVAGKVTKDGIVTVNGKTVAKDALTAGRHNITGSTKVTTDGATFYTRSPKVSFKSAQIDAFVVLDSKGKFQYAILAACGNPVSATNTVTPPKPTPVTPPTTPVTPTKPTPTPPTTPTTPTVPTTPTPETPVTPGKGVETPAPEMAPVAELPKTGAASTLALFAASTVVGSLAYRLLLKRRLAA